MAPSNSRPSSALKGPGSDGKFRWTMDSGEVLAVPSLSSVDIPMSAIEDLSDQARDSNPLIQLGAQVRFLRSFLPAEVGTKLREMGHSEFVRFVSAWGEHSGTTVGELSAS